MYRRNAQGWMKHLDFILLDEAAVALAFFAACLTRFQMLLPDVGIYRYLLGILLLINPLVAVFQSTMHNVLKRGYSKELLRTVVHCFSVFALTTIFLFSTRMSSAYSRIAVVLTSFYHCVLGYLLRLAWKRFLKRRGMPAGEKTTMLAVLMPETAEKRMRTLLQNSVGRYEVVGAVICGDRAPEEICGVPVVAKLEEAAAYISQRWIDAVYIDCPASIPGIRALMDDCREMALTVHYRVASVRGGARQIVENVGGSTVLTTTVNNATATQLLIKRGMDVAGGLLGSAAAVLVILVFGPLIRLSSPGPVLFRQERVGKNGKRFYILKLRSMYVDADARKQELMEKNRIPDGRMFKLDFDPRIIGNRILPDGTRKTGIGEFIRRTSLDEFPQFFNVLAGQMSLVGTRPPTVDEWERYELHHRARLACKPGITGLWQVSGRSDITNFEEVVKLDTEYITNWSLTLDCRILLKTIAVVFGHKGAL